MKNPVASTKGERARRRLAPLLYSSFGLGLCSVLTFAVLHPKWPKGYGE